MKRRYRKQSNQNLQFFVVIAIIALSVIGISNSSSYDISHITRTAIFIICALVIIAGSAFLIYFAHRLLTRRIRAQNFAALHAHNVDGMSGTDFEIFLQHLFIARGYKIKHMGSSGDGGVDLIAIKDKEKISIQAKRYENHKADRRAVTDAVAGITYRDCTRAMAITNSYFTKAAIEYAHKTGCELIDRDELAKWVKELAA